MPLQIPHPNTTLHLYRHLLREASYLPNLCRPWVLNRMKFQFRDRRDAPEPRYIEQAHYSLRLLRSVNAGHVERMMRLFYMATGRIGKRRRQLARVHLCKPLGTSYTADAATADAAALEKDGKQNPKERDPDWLDNWMLDKVRTLARVQAEKQTPSWPHDMRSNLDPAKVIPAENAFGRPLTPKLRRNKLKKFWTSVIHQLLPPLPREEWDALGVLARGEAAKEEYYLRPRRPVARSLLIDAEDLEDHGDAKDPAHSKELEGLKESEEPVTPKEWTAYVTRPARVVERGSSRKMKSLTGEEDQDPRGHGRPIGTRDLNYRNRKLQRLYARVWEACPIMEQRDNGKWSVVWGNSEIKVSRPKPTELIFFKGVKLNGTRAQPEAEPKLAMGQQPLRSTP
ncbi:hypothetical protein F4810DRAFT_518458 [Camillea tinctor]|nr:hypothetical protein F4810DRAFT_518458 [Camillea tinctor]